MAVPSIKIYEALRPTVGDEAAQMVAEALDPMDSYVTKDDLRDAFAKFEARLERRFDQIEAKFDRIDAKFDALQA